MKIKKAVAAIDSFKGSLSSVEAGNAAAEGIRRVFPDAEIIVKPLADGGEGTTDALVSGLCGELVRATASDPLGRRINPSYGIVGGKTAVIEIASAAGITLLSKDELDPMRATTFGVGELISDAIDRGIRDFLIGIGGSATNDGGVGMLTALGFAFSDSDGKPIAKGAAGLERLASIDISHVRPELSECRFRVACDVNNPLCGERGCSAVFSPQKGAKPCDIPRMDSWLSRFAKLTGELFPNADPELPGSGAAGGLGFALRSYLGASLESGVSLVLDAIRLEEDIGTADIIVTGEGRLDAQTAMGKAPAGVAALAKRHGKRCIAFAGSVSPDAIECAKVGIDAYFPILRSVTTLSDAMDKANAARNLADAVEQAFRLIAAI